MRWNSSRQKSEPTVIYRQFQFQFSILISYKLKKKQSRSVFTLQTQGGKILRFTTLSKREWVWKLFRFHKKNLVHFVTNF